MYPTVCLTGLTQWNPSDLSVREQPGLQLHSSSLIKETNAQWGMNFLVAAEKFNLRTASVKSILTSSFVICHAAATIRDRANCSIAFFMVKMC